MATVIQGNFDGQGHAFAIVASRFNSFIVDRLVEGAVDAFVRHGVDPNAVTIFWAPGAFELPLVCQRVAAKGGFDAIVALGCVIRGETDHYELVAAETAKGIAAVAQRADAPIVFGVLTCDSLDQAINRAGAKAGNQGFNAAVSAIELVNLLDQI